MENEKMKFEIIMNMPVRGSLENKTPALVHRLICEHPATSLEQFTKELQTKDYVIVDEYYPDPQTKVYINSGTIALNHRYIGKIKTWDR